LVLIHVLVLVLKLFRCKTVSKTAHRVYKSHIRDSGVRGLEGVHFQVSTPFLRPKTVFFRDLPIFGNLQRTEKVKQIQQRVNQLSVQKISEISYTHHPCHARFHAHVRITRHKKRGGSRAYVPNFSGGDLRPPLEKYPRAHLPVGATSPPTPS
jgi:hypothetical protein